MSDFKGRRFPNDIILVCVRWYCKYGISYRDLEEMMAERGVVVGQSSRNFRAFARKRRADFAVRRGDSMKSMVSPFLSIAR